VGYLGVPEFEGFGGGFDEVGALLEEEVVGFAGDGVAEGAAFAGIAGLVDEAGGVKAVKVGQDGFFGEDGVLGDALGGGAVDADGGEVGEEKEV
jgi:hypothetical protein